MCLSPEFQIYLVEEFQRLISLENNIPGRRDKKYIAQAHGYILV